MTNRRPEISNFQDSTNYLSTPAVAAYFEAREHEAFYRALKHAVPKRDFHDRLRAACETFLESTCSAEGRLAVDKVIAASQDKSRDKSAGSPVAAAYAASPKGVELLEIEEPVSFESLKSAYRRAAKRHHPDSGGGHDAMVAVNEAFRLLHYLLLDAQDFDGTEDVEEKEEGDEEFHSTWEEPKDCADYRYVLGELLLQVTLDDWDLDAALIWLERITSVEWQPYSNYAQLPSQVCALTHPAARLTERLVAAKRLSQARKSLAFAQIGLKVAQANGLGYDYCVREAEAALGGTKRPKITVTHPIQAKHAFRLGIIDKKRFEAVLAKYDKTLEDRSSRERKLRRFQSEIGFIPNLPTDTAAELKTAPTGLVPEPGYGVTRVAWLTDSQKGEYRQAFDSSGSLSLVRKYTGVRLVSLLESILFYPSQVAGRVVAAEAHALEAFGGPPSCSRVANAVTELSAYSLEEQVERAVLLRSILLEGGNGEGTSIRIDVLREPRGYAELQHQELISGSPHVENASSHSKARPLSSCAYIPLHSEYFQVVSRPLNDLRVLARTGLLPETPEEQFERTSSLRDTELLHDPAIRDSSSAAHAVEYKQSDPQTMIDVWSRHLELLLTLAPSITHVERLGLDWWIDRLTIKLVQLKRWDEGLYWLERYYGLPQQSRKNANDSLNSRLTNRLQRCQRENNRTR